MKSYGKIGLDILTVFALPSIDEITDFVSGARHFVKGNPGFGTATLVLPFLPATVAGLLFLRRGGQNDEDEGCCKTFLSFLPIWQIRTHFMKLKEVAKLQYELLENQEFILRISDMEALEEPNNESV